MCVTICGRFCPDEGVVAGYDNRIRVKYTAKWGVQIAGMILGAHSRDALAAVDRIRNPGCHAYSQAFDPAGMAYSWTPSGTFIIKYHP